jgi:hypothetical protein
MTCSPHNTTSRRKSLVMPIQRWKLYKIAVIAIVGILISSSGRQIDYRSSNPGAASSLPAAYDQAGGSFEVTTLDSGVVIAIRYSFPAQDKKTFVQRLAQSLTRLIPPNLNPVSLKLRSRKQSFRYCYMW